MHNIYIDHMLPSFSHSFFEKYDENVFIELCIVVLCVCTKW